MISIVLLISIILWLLLAKPALDCLALITPVFFRVHLTPWRHLADQFEVRALAGLAPRPTMAKELRKSPVVKPKAKHSPKMARLNQRRKPSRKRGHGAAVRACHP